MQEIIDILEQVRNAKGKLKEVILSQHKDNELLKQVLLYTYDTQRTYKFSEKVLNQCISSKSKREYVLIEDIFELLDVLNSNNINDELRHTVSSFLNKYIGDEQELYKMMILQDLKLGVNVSTINKAIPNLIPVWEIQLAKSYKDHKNKVNGEFWISTKLDGFRVCGYHKNGKVKLISRQGKLIEGLVEIEKDILKYIPEGVVIDGELLAEGVSNEEVYKATSKIVSTKDEIKTGVKFNIFDWFFLYEMESKKSLISYAERRAWLDELIVDGSLEVVKILYRGKDTNKISELLQEVRNKGEEGLMINLNKPYQFKRTDALLKVKEFSTMDLRIVDAEEGEGNFKGMLGAFVVEFKDNLVKVGSGYTLEERQEFWDNKDKYIGRILEVQYFEVTKNEQGKESLRFPTFKTIREIGKNVSYE